MTKSAVTGVPARDRLDCLGDLVVDPAQRPPRTVGPVLVVNDLVTPLRRRPCGPPLGEDVSVRDVLAGMRSLQATRYRLHLHLQPAVQPGLSGVKPADAADA